MHFHEKVPYFVKIILKCFKFIMDYYDMSETSFKMQLPRKHTNGGMVHRSMGIFFFSKLFAVKGHIDGRRKLVQISSEPEHYL